MLNFAVKPSTEPAPVHYYAVDIADDGRLVVAERLF